MDTSQNAYVHPSNDFQVIFAFLNFCSKERENEGYEVMPSYPLIGFSIFSKNFHKHLYTSKNTFLSSEQYNNFVG